MLRHLGILLAFSASVAWCVDPTGAIVGLVTDPSGSVIPGAEITVRDQGTNAVRNTVTTETGEFSARLLPAAIYEVTVEVPNFRRSVQKDVEVEVNRISRVDVQLEVGDVRQSIDVTAAAPLLENQTTTIGEVVAVREIQRLPLNERNFLAFTWLVPGAQLPADGSQSASNGPSVSVNGGREQSNNFLLDGVDNNDLAIGTYSALPSAAAIEQFQVQSSNSSAEFGRSGGAQINVVLKSGTNDLHGSAYEFVRNRHMDAKNFFDKPSCTPTSVPGTCGDIPRLDRSQFGGTIGGPIRKDKTFYFLSYEGLRLREGITREAAVPSQIQRTAALAFVPDAFKNPAGVALLNLYPAANAGSNLASSNRYVAAPTQRKNLDQVTGKINQVLGANDVLSGHYALSQGNGFDPYDAFYAFTNLPGYGVFSDSRGQNAAINWSHAVSPRMVNEARFGFNRLAVSRQQQSQGTNYSAELGFPTIIPDPSTYGYPNVLLPGFDSIGEPTNTPQNRGDTTYHIADTLAWNSGNGKHDIRAGVDIRRVRVNLSLYILPRGEFDFSGAFTQNPLSDLVLGVPTYAIGVQGDPHVRLTTLSQNYFVQDDIHLHPHLTLNLGLRYEFNSPPVEDNNALSRPNLNPGVSPCMPQPACLFTVAGTGGLSRSTFSADRNNFAPRVGLAWRPTGLKGTVVRAGYGIFYDISILNLAVSSHFNPPFYQSSFYINTGASNIQNIIGSFALPLPSLGNMIAPDFRDPYIQQWNVDIQHELSANTLIDIAYIGTKGTHLTDLRNPNQPRPGGPPPYPAFGVLTYAESGSSSTYHGLQTRVERRWSHGLSFLMSYTFSKSIDNASSLFQTAAEPAFPQDSLNMRAERGLSNFDARHRFVLSHLFDLPFGTGQRWLSEPGVWNHVLGAWSVSGIWSVQSGRPFTVNRSTDQSGTGTSPLYQADRPDLVADPFVAGAVAANPGCKAPDTVRTPQQWFNPCAFMAAPGRFGTEGRNALIGPGFRNVDLAISKEVPLGKESRQLQFRAEFFNIFNHPNFDIPNRIFDSSAFSVVQSSNGYGNKPPRQIQLSARFQF
jgi:hypothetical protein